MSQLPAIKSLPRINISEFVADRLLKTYVLPLRATGGRIPTNRRLAQQLGVNPATVAKILHRFQAQGLVQSRVGSGTYVVAAHERTMRAGIYYSAEFFEQRPENRIYSFMEREFQRQMSLHEADVRHYFDSSDEQVPATLIRDANNREIDALFIASARSQTWPSLEALPIPTVGFLRGFSHGGVFFDFFDFMHEGVRRLLEQGHRRIALISSIGEVEDKRYMNLFEEFESAMARAGVPVRPEWIVTPPAKRGLYQNYVGFGVDAVRRLLTVSGEKPDGFLIFPDVCALGAVQAVAELGLEISRDIGIATVENKESIWPELAPCIRLQFSLAKVVEKAVSIIDSAIRDGSSATLFVRSLPAPPADIVSSD